jgi:ferredoxin-NADP reductase
MTVLYSARIEARVIYAEELSELNKVMVNLTRVHVCGPTAFVDSITTRLSGLIITKGRIRVERFG